MSPSIAGAIILGVPLLAIAWAFLWQRNRPVFWFSLTLIAVSLGYLMATGATSDIGLALMPSLKGATPAPAR